MAKKPSKNKESAKAADYARFYLRVSESDARMPAAIARQVFDYRN